MVGGRNFSVRTYEQFKNIGGIEENRWEIEQERGEIRGYNRKFQAAGKRTVTKNGYQKFWRM